MRKHVVVVLVLIFCPVLFVTCSAWNKKVLFDGKNNQDWIFSGEVSFLDSVLSLIGNNSSAILQNGNYKDFKLSLKARTVFSGQGYVGIHTDNTGKGYRIALNNAASDSTWWKMSGSLLSVRNLTKSPARDDDWFNMEIAVQGHLITVKINGQAVVEYIEPEHPFRNRTNAGALLSSGTFALVSQGEGALEFKDIRIEETGSHRADIQKQLAKAIDEREDNIIRLHQEDFPVLDYHVHLKDGLNREQAAAQSRYLGINYAIAPNCGVGFPIHDDSGLYSYLDTMKHDPFILGLQAEGREWINLFSENALQKFDFVFTDAMTFNDHKGRRTRLFVKEEVIIDDEQEYMDIIVDRTCDVLQEPVDIFVNPFFLPVPMNDRYDQFWTEERMNKVIDALAKSGKALEINARYKIPNKALIMKAKDAGVKFTFGTNNRVADVGKLEYCVQMKDECNLTWEDMYRPTIRYSY